MGQSSEPEPLYLLDASVLITAHRDYYAVARVPEFWEWLQHQAAAGRVKVPTEILEEVMRGKPRKGMDDLLSWLKSSEVKTKIPLAEEPNPVLVQRVVEGYAPDLNEHEIGRLGRDPFLIAYALVNPAGRRIVTTEVSSPKKKRANRKIPDVARRFGIVSLNPFQFIRELNFTTAWGRSPAASARSR